MAGQEENQPCNGQDGHQPCGWLEDLSPPERRALLSPEGNIFRGWTWYHGTRRLSLVLGSPQGQLWVRRWLWAASHDGRNCGVPRKAEQQSREVTGRGLLRMWGW